MSSSPDKPGMWIRFRTTDAQRLAIIWARNKLGHDQLAPIDECVFVDTKTRTLMRVSVAGNYIAVLEDRAEELYDQARDLGLLGHPREKRRRLVRANTHDVLVRRIRHELSKLRKGREQ